MSEPASRGYLLLRRAGVLWGIDNAAVAGLARSGGTFRIALGTTGAIATPAAPAAIAADEILCVVDHLKVQPVAVVLRRFWPGTSAGVTGVAVHGEQPLLVVDARRPPQVLSVEDSAKESEDDDGERE